MLASLESYRHVLTVRNAEQDAQDALLASLRAQGYVVLEPGAVLIGTRRSASGAPRFISLQGHGG